jgi:hypothetical protein
MRSRRQSRSNAYDTSYLSRGRSIPTPHLHLNVERTTRTIMPSKMRGWRLLRMIPTHSTTTHRITCLVKNGEKTSGIDTSLASWRMVMSSLTMETSTVPETLWQSIVSVTCSTVDTLVLFHRMRKTRSMSLQILSIQLALPGENPSAPPTFPANRTIPSL